MWAHFFLSLIVTSISLLVISKLPLGIEIDSFGSAIVAALVLGVVNALLGPIFFTLAFPLTLVTFGLFSFVVNAALFGLAAWLVSGFRLNGGFLSALIGPIILTLLNALLFKLTGSAFNR
jgi:putative membrane protein